MSTSYDKILPDLANWNVAHEKAASVGLGVVKHRVAVHFVFFVLCNVMLFRSYRLFGSGGKNWGQHYHAVFHFVIFFTHDLAQVGILEDMLPGKATLSKTLHTEAVVEIRTTDGIPRELNTRAACAATCWKNHGELSLNNWAPVGVRESKLTILAADVGLLSKSRIEWLKSMD